VESSLIEATGLNARVLLLKDVVRVQRIGWRNALSGASRVERDVLIRQIVSINFKKAGLLSNGYLEVELIHYDESHKDESGRETDDVIISFRPGQQKAFEAFREMLEARVASSAATRAASPAATDLDQLEKLASLRDRGIITEEEFHRKKRQVLGL